MKPSKQISDVQISDVQMFRRSDVQAFRLSGIQDFRHTGVQTFRRSDVHKGTLEMDKYLKNIPFVRYFNQKSVIQ